MMSFLQIQFQGAKRGGGRTSKNIRDKREGGETERGAEERVHRSVRSRWRGGRGKGGGRGKMPRVFKQQSWYEPKPKNVFFLVAKKKCRRPVALCRLTFPVGYQFSAVGNKNKQTKE